MSELDDDAEVTLKRSELAEMLQECVSTACSGAVKGALTMAFEKFAVAVESGALRGLDLQEEEEQAKSILVKVAASARDMAKDFENLVITGPSGEPL